MNEYYIETYYYNNSWRKCLLKVDFYLILVILIGDCRVGKTSFLYSITNKHQNQIPPTIGVEYQPTTANVQGKTFRVNIWDTCKSTFIL